MRCVTTTASSTLCWKKNAWTSAARWAVSLSVCALAFSLMLPQRAAHAQTTATEVAPLQMERQDDGVYLSTSVRFELPSVVEDALQKGIPMYFLLEADVTRERWYWVDKRLSHVTRSLRLAYQPLTRRWRLSTVVPGANGGSGLGLALGQSFDNLPDALASLQRVTRWKIADSAELENDASYTVDFRLKLDLTQLPRPFQIGAVGQSEWTIAIARRQRLAPGTELAK